MSLKSQRSKWGLIFISPWILGFIVFFLIPIIQSISFSFSKISIDSSGIHTVFKGLNYYKYALFQNANYTDNLGKSISSFVYTLPIIIILSLCIAIVLNGKFKGRALARAMFFLPALMASGVVMSIFNNNIMSSVTSETSSYFSSLVDFKVLITGIGLPESIANLISVYMSNISVLVWNCGVQIILFISGLQSIPRQLYEVAEVEGATAWETFWFVTFPMLTNISLVAVIYTAIDILTSADNEVMRQIYNLIIGKQSYSDGSAMLWIYLAIIGVILALVFFFLNKFFIKKWSVQ